MRRLILLLFTLLFGLPSVAHADEDPKQAREQFVRGTQLVRDADWAGALAAFESSARLRPHPVTTFNIASCLRAMGQYTRARQSFAAALAQSGKVPGQELPPALAEETRQDVTELDRLLATMVLEIAPADALVAVDGRPLDTSDPATLVAGTLPPGPPQRVPHGQLRIRLDPGAHVLVLSRPGFADAVVKETLAPGATLEKRLELDRLPAQIRITSNLAGAQVLVNDADVGLTPVDVLRPAGSYRVVVKKPGYLVFDTSTKADPGQSLAVTATLREDKPALTQRWWFWTGVGVIVVGATLTTYALTRPDPTRPALNGGGLGWTAKAP